MLGCPGDNSADLNAQLPVPTARLDNATAQGNEERRRDLTALKQRGEVMLSITQGCTHTQAKNTWLGCKVECVWA